LYAMAGATPEHAALSVNVSSSLHRQLRGGPCRVFSSDLRLRVSRTGLGTYPDVAVVCGELRFEPESRRTAVTHPTVIVEVLSDSTEEDDRTTKFEHYRTLPSLRTYVLVSHRERLVEVFERGESGEWKRTEARSGGEVKLSSIDCTLEVDEV